MAAGFIHDKLEIKFLILYIAARVSEPLPPEGIWPPLPPPLWVLWLFYVLWSFWVL